MASPASVTVLSPADSPASHSQTSPFTTPELGLSSFLAFLSYSVAYASVQVCVHARPCVYAGVCVETETETKGQKERPREERKKEKIWNSIDSITWDTKTLLELPD